MAKTKEPKLSLVKWIDAHSPPSTEAYNITEIEKVHGTIAITTIGWLLKDDETGVTISGESCGDGDYRNLTFVPRSLVVSVEPITKPRKPLKPKPFMETKTDGI